MRTRILTRTVWVLSLVSLFTDMASEMLYPVMPLYLQSIQFSVLLIGLLEGLAEATAGLSKGYFGKLSDATGRRAPFVQAGYALSALSKPLLVVWALPAWVFAVRTLDRLGKGLRTGARDALLAHEAPPGAKARVFGFHRSMDTLGAVLGPLVALLYLMAFPNDYATLFWLAAVPGALAVGAALLWVRDKKPAPPHAQSATPKARVSFWASFSYWRLAGPAYRRLVVGLLAFALVNSSDVFLLLMAREAGFSGTQAVGLYIFYNLVYALFSYPLGALADRLSPRRVLLAGLVLFAGVYAGMAWLTSMWAIGACFFVYGLYAAATEGVAKAWLVQTVPPAHTATAVGTFSGFQSLCALLASAWAGAVWAGVGPQAVFAVSGVGALGVVAYLAWAGPKGPQAEG